jgi:lauroyl/myristoyl acyltransferase
MRDRIVRLLWRIGWNVGRYVPAPLQKLIMNGGARIAVARGGVHLDHYRRNLSLATGSEPTPGLLRAGVASYLRNLIEAFTIAGWSADKIISSVTTTGEDDLRRAAAERGAVVALPHSGNWDLAGAWACLTGLPVTTVAEQLSDPEFDAFLRFRQGLGMEVISHRDPAAIGELIAAVRSGRVVCLVADRDLLGNGLPVTWNRHPVTMPAGPAIVARRTGAALFPMVSHYTPAGLHLDIGKEIAHRPGRDGLIAMVQDEADFFAARIAERPQDWHLMQPFFTEQQTRVGGAS